MCKVIVFVLKLLSVFQFPCIMCIPYLYSGPCDLRPLIQPEKYGLKLKGVLK